MVQTHWEQVLDRPPTLAANTLHIWRIDVDPPAEQLEAWEALVTADEMARADRFYFCRDRHRFLTCRSSLRHLLGHYLAVPPQAVRFYAGPYGKPYCAPNLEDAPLQFNVSHSSQLALIAVTAGRQLGIDIEFRKSLPEFAEIATSFFSPAEVSTLLALPAPLQPAGFFNCWSRKEAYIKATGKGLSQPLDSFDVSLRPGEPAQLLRVADRPEEVERWQLHNIDAHPDYAAALAVEGDGWQLQCFDFNRRP